MPQNGPRGRLGNFSCMINWTGFQAVHGPVPRYRQVAAFIRQAVEDGRLKPGDALPTETQLSDYMDVSVDTIREALKLLRAEGLVVTSQGIGSFIASSAPGA
jgi:DNA-binding GntR family transcriptional regulator